MLKAFYDYAIRNDLVLPPGYCNKTIQAYVSLSRESFIIPAAQYSSKCKKCSMFEYCMPKVKKSASEYCKELKKEAEAGGCA